MGRRERGGAQGGSHARRNWCVHLRGGAPISRDMPCIGAHWEGTACGILTVRTKARHVRRRRRDPVERADRGGGTSHAGR